MEAGHNCSILLQVEGVMAGLRIMVGLNNGYLQTKVRASLIPDGIFSFFEPLLAWFVFTFFSSFCGAVPLHRKRIAMGRRPPLCFSTQLAEGLNVRDEVMVFDGF